MFDERPNVHKLPFHRHSLCSCFINETRGASWQVVAGCWVVYRKLKPNKQVHFSNEGEVAAAQTGALTSAEHTDPGFCYTCQSALTAPHFLSVTQLTCSQPSLRFSVCCCCCPAGLCSPTKGTKHRHGEDEWFHTARCLILSKSFLHVTGCRI